MYLYLFICKNGIIIIRCRMYEITKIHTCTCTLYHYVGNKWIQSRKVVVYYWKCYSWNQLKPCSELKDQQLLALILTTHRFRSVWQLVTIFNPGFKHCLEYKENLISDAFTLATCTKQKNIGHNCFFSTANAWTCHPPKLQIPKHRLDSIAEP